METLCYREVAVRSFNSLSFRVFVGAPIVISAFFALGGCSDIITYSKDSRDKGMELYGQGNYTDASGAFLNAVRQNPADYRSHYYLADCYARDKAYNQAIQQYQTCLVIMPTTLEGTNNRPFRLKAIDGLAAALAGTGDPQAEVDAVAQGETSQEKYFLLAKVDRNLGDADGAVQAYHQAALLDPKDFDIAREYALYLMKLKDVQAADPALRQAYALNDKDDEINSALREIGVVPGPSLKPENDLARPLLPEGPIPMVDMSKVHLQNPFRTDSDTATSSADASAAPRD
jgi:tetratricopeptide (TPR) repeat protein